MYMKKVAVSPVIYAYFAIKYIVIGCDVDIGTHGAQFRQSTACDATGIARVAPIGALGIAKRYFAAA